MAKSQKIGLFLLRLSLGWVFFYAGLTQMLNPEFSAAGFLNGAKTFPAFFQWLGSPDIVLAINFINQWALVLLGLSLIFGLFVRLSSSFGIVLMFLYYLPRLEFPHIGATAYIVDMHIIYILALLLLTVFRAGRILGLDARVSTKLG